jgi:uncharacterized protein YgfB (UPF0149 family)
MSSPALFVEVAQALAGASSTVDAAEAHGLLCGALCARSRFRLTDWLEEVLPDAPRADAGDDPHSPLVQLYASTTSALAGIEMEFVPLLPDDDEPLADRVASLGGWCQGFLYGFGTAFPQRGRPGLPADVGELLSDFAEIARAGDVGNESESIEESAYVELTEYVRAGTQLIYDELEAERSGLSPVSQH